MAGQKTQRVALVTGAGRGIGRATALALAREGYALCLAARSFEELEETRRLSGLEPARSLIVLIDLAGDESPQELFDAALGHFGQIDVLVNNAGWAPPRTPLLKTSAATQDRILAVNLRAPIALARLAAARMVKNGGGAIVNIASAAARSHAGRRGGLRGGQGRAGRVQPRRLRRAPIERRQAGSDNSGTGRHRAHPAQQASRPRTDARAPKTWPRR